jgi:hypothetical protein
MRSSLKFIAKCAKSTYEWLVNKNAFSGIIGSVLFPLILVPLLVWFTNKVTNSRVQDQETVCLNVPAALANYPFYLRYVREGPGGWKQGEPLYKEDLPFLDTGSVNPDSSRTKCQTISFTRHYGAQFKPYVSLRGKPLSFGQVSELLKKAGFIEISKDSIPQGNNAWFMLPQYQKIEDQGNGNGPGGHIYNNFIAR